MSRACRRSSQRLVRWASSRCLPSLPTSRAARARQTSAPPRVSTYGRTGREAAGTDCTAHTLRHHNTLPPRVPPGPVHAVQSTRCMHACTTAAAGGSLTTFALEESFQSRSAGCAERCHRIEMLELRLRTAELWRPLKSVTEQVCSKAIENRSNFGNTSRTPQGYLVTLI